MYRSPAGESHCPENVPRSLQTVMSGRSIRTKKWSPCGRAIIKMTFSLIASCRHSTGCKKKSNCIYTYGKMNILLTWFIISVPFFNTPWCSFSKPWSHEENRQQTLKQGMLYGVGLCLINWCKGVFFQIQSEYPPQLHLHPNIINNHDVKTSHFKTVAHKKRKCQQLTFLHRYIQEDRIGL